MMTINTTTHRAPERFKTRIEQAEPGEGYRLLEANEVIQRTDEVWTLRHGWIHNNAKVGRPLLTHWRPRRRALPVVAFPLYWDNNGVYRALDKDCFGEFWVADQNRWSRCSGDNSMVEHVKEYPSTYKPITREQARELIGSEAVEPSVQELYSELIYAVVRKHPGESRHQTALRYIREAESCSAIVGEQLSKTVYGI